MTIDQRLRSGLGRHTDGAPVAGDLDGAVRRGRGLALRRRAASLAVLASVAGLVAVAAVSIGPGETSLQTADSPSARTVTSPDVATDGEASATGRGVSGDQSHGAVGPPTTTRPSGPAAEEDEGCIAAAGSTSRPSLSPDLPDSRCEYRAKRSGGFHNYGRWEIRITRADGTTTGWVSDPPAGSERCEEGVIAPGDHVVLVAHPSGERGSAAWAGSDVVCD